LEPGDEFFLKKHKNTATPNRSLTEKKLTKLILKLGTLKKTRDIHLNQNE
jgi:hypothetical protein